MKLGFYRAFEDKYRGSRELIKSRLRAYLPFLTALKEGFGDCKALDVGCGRGEWLELLKELGIDAHGVDLDDGMLAACHALGLSAENAEALTYIKSVPSKSLTVVSGFHFAEHIPFTDLQIFVQEALRVLKPAGLLILETPNPENIVVGTSSFYLDPTHEHPIPPQLLSFLPEYYGFYRTKILRLQEAWELRENSAPSLFNVLGGVSPDYSIVAQKKGNEVVLAAFQDAFEVEYGLTLDELAARYDVLKKTKLDQLFAENENLKAESNGMITERTNLRAEINNISAHYQNALNEIARLRAEFNAREKELADFSAENQKLRETLKNLDMELSRIKIELSSVYSSTSWKITAPLRHTKTVLSSMFHFPQPEANKPIEDPSAALNQVDESQNLSLRAAQIHKDLLAAIEKNKKGG